tara:strand:+ start:241 stop:495 length:255 start_codon:yes stop_codon:yes gene_type:complete
MRKRRNFRKRPKDNAVGLSVTVFNNNVDGALRILKKKVKEANLFQDLRDKEYYTKPSEIKRHKRNLAKLRNKYNIEKEKAKNNY